LYYTADGTAHDAHGNVLENAPKRPENTKPEDQPFARLAAMTSVGPGGFPVQNDMNALGMAIARGLSMASEGKLEPAEDVNKNDIASTHSTRDELAAGAQDAKVKPGATVDARVIPAAIPGGEAAAAAAAAPAVTPTGTVVAGSGAEAGTNGGDAGNR
jgi:hypothetical protein